MSGRSPYSERMHQLVIAKYQAGMNTPEIERRYGIDACTSMLWLLKAGIDTSKRKGKGRDGIESQIKKKAISLYKKGLGSNAIGLKLGVSQTSVLNWVAKLGINRRSHGTKQISDKDIRTIISLYKKGIGSPEIVRKTGHSKSVILGYVKKAGLTRKGKGPLDPRWRQVELQCVICNRVFSVKAAEAKRSNRRCCSQECRGKWLSIHYSRENSPIWEGGKAGEHTLIRNSTQYKEWREMIFQRDQWTCQQCGKVGGGRLEAHHILSFSKYPQIRFDIKNGITLCELCHKRLHGLTREKKYA